MNVAARNKNANKNKNKNVQSTATQSAKAENGQSQAQSQGINDGDLFGTFPTEEHFLKAAFLCLKWDFHAFKYMGIMVKILYKLK